MCFAPQRHAIFPHLQFKKWSVPVSFFTFWLTHVLLATAACKFSGSKLPKSVPHWGLLVILTCKCASRHSGVWFLNIGTSKIGLALRFLGILTNVLRATAACDFWTSELPKAVPHWGFLDILTWNVLCATAACHFSSVCWTAASAPAALARLLFEHQEPRIIEKTQRFATSLTFGACVASSF